MEQLNEFQTMWMSYPDASSVLDQAFSKTNSPETSEATRNWIRSSFQNTCCVRLCYSLNHTVSHRVSQTDARAAGLSISDYVTGKNGKYIFNVPNVSDYLKDRYGAPTKKWEGTSTPSREDFAKEIANQQGIIIFHEQMGDLNGHVDLWEKGLVKTYNLFDTAHSMEFWVVSN
ncbi:T6SS effector amidase Tae4 family protein [Zobellia laminariae]|uniref:T6SS effector amidase Tae4 family protein n=1 Tax=Zobellia laminariae TaxID=248906 RepID=UPI0026F44C3E|nr:T6SS effector amidase Tae4 family protein [Zobellia laminariae]WKX76713.1 T6SS effector amidase Tae4 family protein [Zobellia laminariae]